LGDSLPPHVVY
jgi:V8-like Glu-specific endopeptidase